MTKQTQLPTQQPEALQLHLLKGARWTGYFYLNTVAPLSFIGSLPYKHSKDELIDLWNTTQMAVLTKEYALTNEYEDPRSLAPHYLRPEIEVFIERPSNRLSVWQNMPDPRVIASFYERKTRTQCEDLWSILEDIIKIGDFVIMDETETRME